MTVKLICTRSAEVGYWVWKLVRACRRCAHWEGQRFARAAQSVSDGVGEEMTSGISQRRDSVGRSALLSGLLRFVAGVRKSILSLCRLLFESVGSDLFSHLALNRLDRKLAKYLNYRSGVFIEVGANDGLTQSNTYWFERFMNWRGLLIEPVPEKAAACQKNRPLSRVFCNALVGDSRIRSVKIVSANLMAYVAGSFDSSAAEHAHRSRALRVQHLAAVQEIEVPARTVASLIEECGLTGIDLFSVDVEGYELEVLRGLCVERHRPRFILVETQRVGAVLEVLRHNYVLLEQLTPHDYLLQSRT